MLSNTFLNDTTFYFSQINLKRYSEHILRLRLVTYTLYVPNFISAYIQHTCNEILIEKLYPTRNAFSFINRRKFHKIISNLKI